MRRLPVVLGLALVIGACDGASTDDNSDGAVAPVPEQTVGSTAPQDTTDASPADPATTTQGDEMPDANAPDDPSAIEPNTGDSTPPTLVLNPTKSTPPAPPPTSGAPIGGNEPLYPGQIDARLQPFIDLSIADLAGRLGVGEAEIETISATLVTWPDSSMGCPTPGMAYAQVMQDGSLIELGHATKVYRYHSGGRILTPFLCNQPLAAPPVSEGAADS